MLIVANAEESVNLPNTGKAYAKAGSPYRQTRLKKVLRTESRLHWAALKIPEQHE